MKAFAIEPDEDEDEALEVDRNRRIKTYNECHPMALRKCPRCGAYFAEVFFRYPSKCVCKLCEHEAEHPLATRREGRA